MSASAERIRYPSHFNLSLNDARNFRSTSDGARERLAHVPLLQAQRISQLVQTRTENIFNLEHIR